MGRTTRLRPGLALALLAAAVAEPCRAQDSADVARGIVPFVRKHCVGCHGAEQPKAGLSLHGFGEAKAVLKERKLWDAALHRIEAGEMPPPKQPQPTADEKAAFAKSMRALFARADAGPPDPGRIPVRRLNRTEYANTVRELLQLDLAFSPESELPTDAVTHGFDNNAEALAISPVLLDCYLSSAEMIAERAVRAELPERRLVALEHPGQIGPNARPENLPVARLVERLAMLAAADPRDALVRHRLARAHAAAYGLKSDTVPVVPGDEVRGVWFGAHPGHLPFEVRRSEDPAKLKAAGEHLDRALTRYREVLVLEPENLPARLGLAWCLAQAGDKAAAVREFRAAIEAAWMKERDSQAADWKVPSVTTEAVQHLLPLLDKEQDAREIAELKQRDGQLKAVLRESPWRQYRLLDSSGTQPWLTGPFYYFDRDPGAILRYSPTDEFLFRATVFVEAAGPEPVRVALLAGGPGLPEYSTDAELSRLSGSLPTHPEHTPVRILKIAEVTARSIDAPQPIEVLVSRRGRRGPIHNLGLALIKPEEDASLVRLYFKLESEGPLPPLSHRHVLACSPDKPQAEQTREIVGRLLPRAFRRPVAKDEIEAVAKFADRAVADGQKWEVGIQRALMAMLCSPKFLFRAELDDRPDSAEPHPIGEFELASRLSYFLWSSLPDDELFGLAGAGKLSANLETQVRRMLQDPKSAALIDNFATQWLDLSRLQTHTPDSKLFPKFDRELREAMLGETRAFLQHVVREDRSLLDLIDADYTFLNGRLGQHYGIADTLGNRPGPKPAIQGGAPIPGNRFVRVQLQGTERGGLLTQAAILTLTSPPTRTSPVKRGAWVLEKILGTPPPPPPPNVPELDPQAVTATSLRERLEQHRADPACASCHAKIDPLGFAFENYDAVGAFRRREGNKDVDASGTLPDGRRIDGMSGLRQALLADRERFARHVAENLLTYALGRGVEHYDRRAVDRIVSETAKDEFRFSRMVVATVLSDPFRLRRGRDQSP